LGELGRGSKVRVMYTEGNEHPIHGTSTYLNKVKVIELNEIESNGDF
jgi:hypothetical protein